MDTEQEKFISMEEVEAIERKEGRQPDRFYEFTEGEIVIVKELKWKVLKCKRKKLILEYVSK